MHLFDQYIFVWSKFSSAHFSFPEWLERFFIDRRFSSFPLLFCRWIVCFFSLSLWIKCRVRSGMTFYSFFLIRLIWQQHEHKRKQNRFYQHHSVREDEWRSDGKTIGKYLDLPMNIRPRPTLVSTAQTAGLRAATAFTTGLTLPGGYT